MDEYELGLPDKGGNQRGTQRGTRRGTQRGTQKGEVGLPCSIVAREPLALLDFMYLFFAGWHWGTFFIRLLR